MRAGVGVTVIVPVLPPPPLADALSVPVSAPPFFGTMVRCALPLTIAFSAEPATLLTPCAPLLHGLHSVTEAEPARIWAEVAGPLGFRESFQVSLPVDPAVANFAVKSQRPRPTP